MTDETKINEELRAICRTMIPGYNPWDDAGDSDFDDAAAETAIAFFHEVLTHIEGDLAGKPFILQPWQQAIVGNLFGWKRVDEMGRKVRRFREAFIYTPRKQGKTPLASGIANLVLFTDDEASAQCYCAAADKDQATLLFRHTKGMIENESELSERCVIYKATRSIEMEDGGTFKVLSADADTKHGGNSHLVIVDELHAQPNRDLVDTLQTSFASTNRKQPLLIFITTADFDRPSICNEKLDYASKVRDGFLSDSAFLPVIFEARLTDDWTSEDVWRKANPNLGVSVSLDYLRRECKRAQESPAYLNTFLRLHLNVKTTNDVAWIDMLKWDECGALPVNLGELEGRECFAGLDLSSTTDVSALVLVFPDGGGYIVAPFFWIPSDNAHQRERRDRVPYLTWERQGLIELTEGNVIDYARIHRKIGELGKQFNIRTIAIDRWNATMLSTQLMGDGFNVTFFGQGFGSMNSPTKELEKLIKSVKLSHGGHAVLRWMASNLTVETDAAGNVKPSKSKSTEKIDGMVSLVMAIGVATSGEVPKTLTAADLLGFM